MGKYSIFSVFEPKFISFQYECKKQNSAESVIAFASDISKSHCSC